MQQGDAVESAQLVWTWGMFKCCPRGATPDDTCTCTSAGLAKLPVHWSSVGMQAKAVCLRLDVPRGGEQDELWSAPLEAALHVRLH